METKFTKGQWSVNKHNNVYSKYQLPIAVIYDGSTAHNSFRESDVNICRANALLISKAPEMFEMLESILELQKENYGSGMNTHLALITKAKEIEQLLKEATEL